MTEDIIIPTDGTWLEVPLTSSTTIVFNGSGIGVMYRFGISSTSDGIRLAPGDMLSIEEVIYMRVSQRYLGSTNQFKVTVTR